MWPKKIFSCSRTNWKFETTKKCENISKQKQCNAAGPSWWHELQNKTASSQHSFKDHRPLTCGSAITHVTTYSPSRHYLLSLMSRLPALTSWSILTMVRTCLHLHHVLPSFTSGHSFTDVISYPHSREDLPSLTSRLTLTHVTTSPYFSRKRVYSAIFTGGMLPMKGISGGPEDGSTKSYWWNLF